MVRTNLIKKVRLMQRLEGDEEVHQMMSYGTIVQTNCTAKAKALDWETTGMSVWLELTDPRASVRRRGDRDNRLTMEGLVGHCKDFVTYSEWDGSHCKVLNGWVLWSDLHLSKITLAATLKIFTTLGNKGRNSEAIPLFAYVFCRVFMKVIQKDCKSVLWRACWKVWIISNII